ncbi:hypothetical protein K458DRAFT_385019 [Lentithecium fluviatile CBS 122367]|uniref:Heterokaryon incompatibility domain-containing protein n=1 Tax=Lentithecium fluviatile CBS 122367 TaxID=1168545 RepID=A0A6G1JE61_9PLEO|nr:hypothetical protein K458DRAFT_385019 [Lentithecium fluviatile CBS 122367]
MVRPWFSRVWCIREVALAHDAEVACGNEEINWHHFGSAIKWFADQIVNDHDLRGAREVVRTPAGWLYAYGNPYAVPFQQIFKAFREWNATDPRDKVFALLGFVEVEIDKPMVEVDYEKSVAEVCTDTAISVIQRTEDLWILMQTYHGRGRMKTLPKRTTDLSGFDLGFIDFMECVMSITLDSNYNATENFTNYFQAILECFRERRLFFMSRNYLGLGPACMREGDIVVVLDGGEVPFVLRPISDSEYALMGGCVVYDIMEGQVFDKLEQGEEGVEERMFTSV